ncbi:MAG: DUF1840 domain-containing protein [Candidatus Contendobacter sp.]|nr:DUF1840 domain-containing protein [Candidatus Contendobacter sp.]
MIVTFRTKAHADIVIFGDIAITLLKLMGHSGTVPSALLADEVPAALERLRTAVAAHKATVPKAAEDVEDDDADESPVDLAQRAFPLIELLAAAATEKCDVMWDQ